MIEKDIEDKIIAGLESALGSLAHYTTGAWQFGAQACESETPVVLEVRVQPRGYENETSPCIRCSGSVRVVWRREQDDSETTALMPYLEAIAGRLSLWQMDFDAAYAALSGSTFTLAGFVVEGGDFGTDDASGTLVWDSAFTVRGTI